MLNWKTFEGFSRYLISNEGRVFDAKNNYEPPFQISPDGYYKITLRGDNGKRKTFSVHRLVALTFIDNPELKREVNHKDGDKLNNHYNNLEWVTHAENIQHAWDTGLLKSTELRSKKLSKAHTGRRCGIDNHNSVKVILLNTGEIFDSMNQAVDKYNVQQASISRCCQGTRGIKSAGKHPVTKEKLVWAYYIGETN